MNNNDNIHTCSYSCERPACIKAQRDELAQRLLELVAEAVAAEREACAKVCEDAKLLPNAGPLYCAAVIRARGQ